MAACLGNGWFVPGIRGNWQNTLQVMHSFNLGSFKDNDENDKVRFQDGFDSTLYVYWMLFNETEVGKMARFSLQRDVYRNESPMDHSECTNMTLIFLDPTSSRSPKPIFS